ncbi:hypothetical protein DTO164E3_232 [Paecilomyces variotii]|nr:hypothetical protein DTO032I3_8374 [Paecilomyces variotii]KAJ9207946.1 hypothetical protein DTO164E3_232 [Paecilomyces variotii]KAJ9227654.1 hypothetical protein DTO169C6_295 [Paecilomyces variotii]KAJ9274341.1 hypothetical protein DTO021D3_8812 [Paecilomyces variotii]KAJ9339062.1 hypothetical protein DTO027B6_8397 [Paecilomyces variotii]
MEDHQLLNHSNSARFFHWRYREAEKLLNNGNEEDGDKAEETCRELLLEATLPLYIRARCHTLLAVCDGNYLYHARKALHLYQEFAADEPHLKVWQEASEAMKEIVRVAEEDWEKEHGTIPPDSTEIRSGAGAEAQADLSTRSLGESTKGPLASLQRTTGVGRQKTDETATASAFSSGDMETSPTSSHGIHEAARRDSDEQSGTA